MTGPKILPDVPGADVLKGEKSDHDHDRNRHDPGLELAGRYLQSFHRAQDRHRRREHSIAVEQRCPEDSEEDQRTFGLVDAASDRQCQQSQDAAFTVVARPHYGEQILDPHDEDQSPKDERQHTQ